VSVSLKYISTEKLIGLSEYLVEQDYDEGLDVLLDEVLIVLLYRLPLVAYHRQVHEIEAKRKLHT